MPRNSERERQKLRKRLNQYLAPVLALPINYSVRDVSVKHVATAINAGKDTVRHYGADLLAVAAAAIREAHSRAGRAKQGIRGQLQVMRMERDDWKTRFEGAQRQLLAIQYHLQRRSDIDLDTIMRSGVPAPPRDRPALQPIRRSKNIRSPTRFSR